VVRRDRLGRRTGHGRRRPRFSGLGGGTAGRADRDPAAVLQSVESHEEDFVALITRENGKPRRDARAEFASGLADARHAVGEAERLGIVDDFSASHRVRAEQYQEPSNNRRTISSSKNCFGGSRRFDLAQAMTRPRTWVR
jgi:hypothetical protein